MLRSGEAAKVLGVSKFALLAWVRNGRLRAINISNTERPQYRFERADLEALRAQITVNPDKGAA